jgi:hypothetical protein
MVIRLAPFLVEKGYFEEVQFVFLVVGHTKNVADRLFNICKHRYCKCNIFTMGQLKDVIQGPQVSPHLVDWCVFFDYDKMLNKIYRSALQKVNAYQIFMSNLSGAIGAGKIECRSSNLANVVPDLDNMNKRGVAGDARATLLSELEPEPLYKERPGLKPRIKQCELYLKFRPHVPLEYREECCPKPSLEVLESEKKRKREKGQGNRKLKKEKEQDNEKSKVAEVAAANNDCQELTTEMESELAASAASSENGIAIGSDVAII